MSKHTKEEIIERMDREMALRYERTTLLSGAIGDLTRAVAAAARGSKPSEGSVEGVMDAAVKLAAFIKADGGDLAEDLNRRLPWQMEREAMSVERMRQT